MIGRFKRWHMSCILEPSSHGPASACTGTALNRSQGLVMPALLACYELAGVAMPVAPARARVARTIAPGWPGLPCPDSHPRRGCWPSTCELLRQLSRATLCLVHAGSTAASLARADSTVGGLAHVGAFTTARPSSYVRAPPPTTKRVVVTSI